MKKGADDGFVSGSFDKPENGALIFLQLDYFQYI